MSSHYSAAFQPEFSVMVNEAAIEIAKEFDTIGVGYPVLCYTGFSGISTGTMLAHFLREHIRVEQFYVRKENEDSHGGPVEFSTSDIGVNGVPVFVDDFIATGTTREWVRRQVHGFYLSRGTKDHLYPWGVQKQWHVFKLLDDDRTMPHVLIKATGELNINLFPVSWKRYIP